LVSLFQLKINKSNNILKKINELVWLGLVGDKVSGSSFVVLSRYLLILLPDIILMMFLSTLTCVVGKIDNLNSSVRKKF